LTTATITAPPTGFGELSLETPVLAALQRVQYHQPTPIQAALIPHALAGRDVLGQAQTGTGKTAAFLLPFMNSWKDINQPGPQAIVLAPTRELVVQVTEEAKKLAPSKNFRALAVYGGQRMREQLLELKRGVDLVIGTPGRVLDHLGRGTLVLSRVRYAVLDEADRMLDIGFRPDIERILRQCPQARQTLLMSATLPAPVLRLTHRYMIEPIHLNLTPEKPTVDSIRQSYFSVEEERKFDLLLKVMAREKPRQCIIFCQRKRSSAQLFKLLRAEKQRAAVMHGDLPQPMRERIMQAFRDGKITYLVATDVVGRGIDVTNISHIINYDLPEDPENYVHRIGRTGRMGKDGRAIAFVTPEQGELLTNIEMVINKLVDKDHLAGFVGVEPRAPKAPEPPKVSVPVFGRKVKRYSSRL
jgi:ATP-dependent RNA helicase DeaD